MNIPFVKMNSNGNDFVIVDIRKNKRTATKNMIKQLSDRNRGIGFDQYIQIEGSSSTDVFMRTFNSNGKEAEMCCNAARCVGSLIIKSLKKNKVSISTISESVYAEKENNGLISIKLILPKQTWKSIPLSKRMDLNDLKLDYQNGAIKGGMAVNMGNPHVIFFCKNIEEVKLTEIGPLIEKNTLFPNGTNVGIIKIINNKKLKVRIWERGVGLTLSCGSGALASFYSAYKMSYCSDNVEVILPGGKVTISIFNNNHLKMTGPVETSFLGEVNL